MPVDADALRALDEWDYASEQGERWWRRGGSRLLWQEGRTGLGDAKKAKLLVCLRRRFGDTQEF
jgi:hypothetical protein